MLGSVRLDPPSSRDRGTARQGRARRLQKTARKGTRLYCGYSGNGLLLTPAFRPVVLALRKHTAVSTAFQHVTASNQAVETADCGMERPNTWLKPGVNEMRLYCGCSGGCPQPQWERLRVRTPLHKNQRVKISLAPAITSTVASMSEMVRTGKRRLPRREPRTPPITAAGPTMIPSAGR